MQQWLKSAEDTNEKWRINAENTKLVTNELNHLKALQLISTIVAHRGIKIIC
jgi:uncharacterized protein YhaN